MGEQISRHDEELDGIYVRPLLIIFFTDNIMLSFRNVVFITEFIRKKHYNTVNEEVGTWLGKPDIGIIHG